MFVQETGVDRTGLGCWSWVRVGTVDHSTWIISAYQPCDLTETRTSTLDTSGKMKRSCTVWAQHVHYLQKRGIFNDPRMAFCQRLITQLKHWHAKGDKIILFADLNKNVNTGQLAWFLQGNNLIMSEQTLLSTGSEAPFSHRLGTVAIIGTFETPGIVCRNSYISPHNEGVGAHRFHVHDFDAGSVLGTTYPKFIHLAGHVLCCGVKWTVKKNNKVLRQLTMQHRSFEKIEYLHRRHSHLRALKFQLMFNVWDRGLTQLMLGSEKRCNKFSDGSIDFTPVTGLWICCL
jgi:hypothetical protein